MGQSLPDIRLTDEWVDITTLSGYGATANALITVQAKFVSQAIIYVGGASAPTNEDDGMLLQTAMSVSSTAAHWWVKGQGKIAILVE